MIYFKYSYQTENIFSKISYLILLYFFTAYQFSFNKKKIIVYFTTVFCIVVNTF